MSENPCAAGLLRAHKLTESAGRKAQRLGTHWDERKLYRRRLLLSAIEADLAKAHSLVRSAQAVARHRGEA